VIKQEQQQLNSKIISGSTYKILRGPFCFPKEGLSSAAPRSLSRRSFTSFSRFFIPPSQLKEVDSSASASMLNMHRPADQAKLLLFALLRGTVSSLATEPKSVVGGMGLAVKNAPNLFAPNIQLRLARRADVLSIQRCNLATLPENYNAQFYVNHLRQWPDLCLVAEDTMGMDSTGMEPDRPFGGASWGAKPEPNVVAYVLGKVEERPPPRQYYHDGYQVNQPMEEVLQPYRRKGLAAALMKQLHYHLEEAYGAGAVGLHVRKSNEAACRLYQNYGYQIDLTIPGYYQDGEDAYFMKKPLQTSQAAAFRSEAPKFPFLGRKPHRPWEYGPPDLRLPRAVGEPRPEMDDNSAAERMEQQNSGLLTGSM
jgi:ribosomal protein S18 acetylase RimI-like enzyme